MKTCIAFVLVYLLHQCAAQDPQRPERCQQLPVNPGICRDASSKWYYDNRQEKCLEVRNGGCNGNEDLFDLEGDCMNTCVLEVGDGSGEPDPDIESPGKIRKSDECSNIMCLMHCEHGFEYDANNCQICKCASSEPECPTEDIMCAMHCPNGFQRDSNGCEICKCIDPPKSECSQIICLMYCENGFETDDNGCAICKCKESPKAECSQISCLMYCENGFEKDANGCDICKCKEVPKSECSVLSCMMECPLGFKEDKSGCPVCECRDQCPALDCYMSCPGGRVKDDYGCDKCECQTPKITACSKVQCKMFCQFGFAKDSNGCNKCACAEDPCKILFCPQGTLCKVVDSSIHMGDKLGVCVDTKLPELCLVKNATGMCKGFFQKYYFSVDSGRCEGFVYGGCGGNDNNFESDEFCHEKCPGLGPIHPAPTDKDDKLIGCSEISCNINCLKGLQTDRHGCPICRCRPNYFERCEIPNCNGAEYGCEFGQEVDSSGCAKCSCLNDPCFTRPCDKRTVCVTVASQSCGFNCPSRAVCVEFGEVRKVFISFDYQLKTKEANELDLDLLQGLVKDRISHTLQVDAHSIKDIKLRPIDESRINIQFFIIHAGAHDIVKITHDLQEKVQGHASSTYVQIGGNNLTPDVTSFTSRFSNDEAIPSPRETQEADSKRVLIIAAAAGGGLLLIILVALFLSRKKQEEKTSKEHVQYIKAPIDDVQVKNGKAETEKMMA